MKTNPKAWYEPKRSNCVPDDLKQQEPELWEKYTIPLYSFKELTDEEIKECEQVAIEEANVKAGMYSFSGKFWKDTYRKTFAHELFKKAREK